MCMIGQSNRCRQKGLVMLGFLLVIINCCLSFSLYGQTKVTNVPYCFSSPSRLVEKGKTSYISSKNKILFIVPWLTVGGMDRAFIDMIDGLPLSTKQYDVCILHRGMQFEKLLRKGSHIITLKEARAQRYHTVVSFAQWINPKLWVPTISAENRVQWVHTDLIASGFTKHFPDAKLRKKVNSFICVSDKATESFRKLYPTEERKATTVLNVVNSEDIRQKATMRQDEITPSSTMLNVVTVCRISPEKALDRAIRVHNRLEKEGIHFRWYIVGGDVGNTLAGLKKAVDEFGLQKRFIFLGTRLNPYPYIKAADIFVLASYYEGWGLVITEAKILGRPILAADTAGAREQIRQGVTGLIVDSNEEAIYRGLKKMLLNKKFRDSLAANLKDYKHDNSSVFLKLQQLLHIKTQKAQ